MFISGSGGIGKSELAKNYAKTYQNDYDSIIFTTYNGSFQGIINDDSNVHIANFFSYPGEEERGYFVYDLNVLSEKADLVQLFHKYFLNNTVGEESSVAGIADEETSAILEIIDYVDGHTLSVELIARQTKAGFLTPAQMLIKLKEHGLLGSGKEKINSTKDNRQSKKTTFDYMAAIFDIANLSEQEKYVLANMAHVPIDRIRGDLFKEYCGLETLMR